MRETLCVFATVLAALLCACSGGNSAPQTVTKSASPSPRQVSQADLPNMVFISGDLAAAYSGFVLDSSNSGPKTRDDRINDACDPEKQRSELDATRWVAGYDAEYSPPAGTLDASDGTFMLGSIVDLFQDGNGAAEAFQEMISDDLQEANTECKGVNIGVVQKFDVPTIGDESWGSDASFTVSSGNRNLSGVLTTVISRKGQVVLSVGIARLGETGASDEAVRVLRLLVERGS